jgi:hypothetical protein
LIQRIGVGRTGQAFGGNLALGAKKPHRKTWDDSLVPIVGARVDTCIEVLGLTMNGLAKRLQGQGVKAASRQTLDGIRRRRLRRGRKKRCRASVRAALADEFGVPEEWLADEAIQLPGLKSYLQVMRSVKSLLRGEREPWAKRKRDPLQNLVASWPYGMRLTPPPPSPN